MDDKKVDGIKKLNKEEIKKSREAVLSVIKKVEQEETDVKKKKDKKPAKIVDAIVKRQEPVTSPDFKSKVSESDKYFKEHSAQLPVELAASKPAFKPSDTQASEVKKLISKNSIKKEQEKAALEKKRLKEKKQEAEEKKLIEEKKKINEQKKIKDEKDKAKKKRRLEEDKKKKKEEMKILRKKKKEDKKEKIKSFKKGFKKNFKKFILNIIKIFFNIILVTGVLSILFYTVFAVMLLKFKVDNNFTRSLTIYVKVPAVITKIGIIDYYTYFDEAENLKEEINNSSNYLSQLRRNIASMILRNKLIDKYNINTDLDPNALTKEITLAVIGDRDINQVGINRINKIKEMIDKGENFVEVSTKFGDKLEKIDFSSADEAKKYFGEEAASLNVGEISSIITRADGYYILRRYEKPSLYALSYVFISAVSFNDYINEEASKLKMWSLVDIK